MRDAERRPAPLAGILGAISFLTLLPVRGSGDVATAEVGRGAVYFPLVGAAIGGSVALSGWAAQLVLPAPVAALIAVGVGVLLTGALHVDGLADTLDGYGGRGRARALEIMRDHSVGSYGVVGVVLDLAVRVAAIDALLPRATGVFWLIGAGALSRTAAVGLGALLPHARIDGGQATLLDGVGRRRAAVSIAIGVGVAVACLGWHGILAAITVGAAAVLWGRHCLARLGGVTGDTLGAASEVGEVLVLLLALVLR